MTVGVIIPALNAAVHLPALLADIRDPNPDWRVLIVDDGSSDDTGVVAAVAGAEVARHEVNRGKGAALATGFDWALAPVARMGTQSAAPSEIAARLRTRFDNERTDIATSRQTIRQFGGGGGDLQD